MTKHFFWHLNYDCNQNCIYCHTPPRISKFGHYTLDEAKNRIDEFVKNGITALKISGGEPTLNKNLPKIIEYAKKKNIEKVELMTNGTNLHDAEYVQCLKKNGLDAVSVSFPSHVEKIFELIRNSKERSFAKTIKGLYNTLGHDIETSLVHVICEPNYRLLPSFVEMINKNLKGISFINFALVSPVGRSLDNRSVVVDYARLKPLLKNALQRAKDHGIYFDVSSIVPLCLVDGFEEYISSVRFSLNNHTLIDDGCNDITVDKLEKIKFNDLDNNTSAKAPQCVNCSLNELCAGFFPGYASIWGYDFFTPSSVSKQSILEKINLSL